MISTTYIAVVVNILSTFLPKIGITIGSEELTTTIQTLITFGTGIWILYQRYSKGGVNIFGVKK